MYCIILHCIVNKAKYHLKTILSWQEIIVYLLYQIGKKTESPQKKKNYNKLIIIIITKIFIMVMQYKGKQKEVKKDMSDLQKAIPMIFISIIFNCTITFSS